MNKTASSLQAIAHARLLCSAAKMTKFMARPGVRTSVHVCMLVCAGVMLSATAADALAQSQQMPWEGPLCAVANSMRSTVAKAAAVIAIVVAGLALAFGEMNGIFKTIMGLIAGSSMALLATSWLSFLGGGSAFC